MPNPIRAWTVSINNAFSNQTDQQVQFKEAFWNRKNTYVLAGWTVQLSSDGTTNVGAADYLVTATDVALGAAGSGAWCVLRSPPGWLPNAAQIEVLMYVNDTGLNPSAAPLIEATGTYSGGSLVTLPTQSGGVETAPIAGGVEIINWSTVIAGRWASWYTSRGDVMFATKVEGDPPFRFFDAMLSNVDANGGGRGNQRWFYVGISDGSNALSFIWLTNSGYFHGVTASGGGTMATVFKSSAWVGLLWTAGIDFQGETIDASIDVFQDRTGGRYLGQTIDLYAAPNDLGEGTLDDTESAQTLRRVSKGALWLYVPTADLPFV